MTQHIFMNRDRRENHIRVYYSEPHFVVVADRTDFKEIDKLDKAHLPGIYVLLSAKKRYVGQASNDIYSRLQRHDANKDWWTQVVFFGKEDGHLSKAQLDYLEKKLILEFGELGYELDNETVGNDSYIGTLDEIRAEDLMGSVQEVMNVGVHLGFFDRIKTEKRMTVSSVSRDEIVVDFGENHYAGRSFRGIFRELINDVIPKYEENLISIMAEGRSNTHQFIGTVELIGKTKQHLTHKVIIPKTGREYDVYTNFSTAKLDEKIRILAKLTGQSVNIQYPEAPTNS